MNTMFEITRLISQDRKYPSDVEQIAQFCGYYSTLEKAESALPKLSEEVEKGIRVYPKNHVMVNSTLDAFIIREHEIDRKACLSICDVITERLYSPKGQLLDIFTADRKLKKECVSKRFKKGDFVMVIPSHNPIEEDTELIPAIVLETPSDYVNRNDYESKAESGQYYLCQLDCNESIMGMQLMGTTIRPTDLLAPQKKFPKSLCDKLLKRADKKLYILALYDKHREECEKYSNDDEHWLDLLGHNNDVYDFNEQTKSIINCSNCYIEDARYFTFIGIKNLDDLKL